MYGRRSCWPKWWEMHVLATTSMAKHVRQDYIIGWISNCLFSLGLGIILQKCPRQSSSIWKHQKTATKSTMTLTGPTSPRRGMTATPWMTVKRVQGPTRTVIRKTAAQRAVRSTPAKAKRMQGELKMTLCMFLVGICTRGFPVFLCSTGLCWRHVQSVGGMGAWAGITSNMHWLMRDYGQGKSALDIQRFSLYLVNVVNYPDAVTQSSTSLGQQMLRDSVQWPPPRTPPSTQ